MELKWLEDLVALAESPSLTEAARRRNVTQPAFTRRIKAIERWLGAEVIDRARKPAQARPLITRRLDTLKALASDLRRLREEVLESQVSPQRIVIATQHSLTVGLVPEALSRVQATMPDVTFRLRSANRDECFGLLMTRQAHVMVAYETARLPVTADETLVEKLGLADDWLVPVATPGLAAGETLQGDDGARRPLRIVTYPRDVFFGAILYEEVLSPLAARFQLHTVCETALVPGVMQLALSGIGIAWVPLRLARSSIASGALADLGEALGRTPLRIVATRLQSSRSRIADELWSHLAASQQDL